MIKANCILVLLHSAFTTTRLAVSSVTAPAHEQHVISLHKHGHHFGGLPMLFWASIGLLIAVFHLFLFKLIFNEYCQSSEPSYIRPKYNM